MRDPLSWVPIRYKLPLGFLCICLVAFGVGGVVLTQTAGEALESEIRRRLDEQVETAGLAVERRLELFGRRAEDFASDGYIRVQTAAIAGGLGGDDDARAREEAALRRHFLVNKLPIVEAFVDAAVLGEDGRPLLDVTASPDAPAEAMQMESTYFGRLLPLNEAHPYPTFQIATPLASLEGDRRIGTLVLLVRADTWAKGLLAPGALEGRVPTRAELVDPAGRRLPLATDAVDASDGAAETRYETPIELNGWTCVLGIDLAAAMQPIAELRNRYLLIGGLLLLIVAAVLFFPMQFLLRPLNRIAEAARSLAAGEFRTRVESESRDEIGDLSTAFNVMADAVEERTSQLEQTARTLARRERDIRFERDRLNAVIRAMDDGLFIVDHEGRVVLANAAAQPLVRALEEKGPSPERIDCGRERDDGDLDCLQCLADGASRIRSCVVHREGRFYEVQVTTLPAPGRARGGRICVSRDITTRIAEADQQAHQERMAVLGEIAAVMAHELNNPLAAISMFSQMLEGGLAEGSEERESAAVIRRNTETCKRSIRGLLDLAAQATPEPGPFDVHAMLEDVRLLLRPIYQRAGVAVRVEPGDVDPTAFGDELQLRQVMVNLVLNAIQAFERAGGEVVIRTRAVAEDIEVEVRDDGPGVPEEIAPLIFEPFFTTKPPGTGTGLGLPTSRRVVEAHRGKLELVETGPSGTVFRLRLSREGTVSSWRTSVRLKEERTREAAFDAPREHAPDETGEDENA